MLYSRKARCGVFVLLACVSTAGADERAPLPEPLTLEHALGLAEEGHPQVAEARAAMAVQDAEVQAAEARKGVNITLEGRLRWVEPADIAADQSNDDHRAALLVRKNLYDFGRTDAYREAAMESLRASRLRYADSVRSRRLAIMQAYFDVLLADMAFARDNEDLAVVFVSLDRLRSRHELGQVSDIELLELESAYQESRLRRARSQNRQREARSRLAIALDRPGMLPSEVTPPELPHIERELPVYEALLEKALADNPAVRARRAEVQAAEQRLAATRAGDRPYLDGELEAAEYTREMGSYDKWRAGVVLTVPLYTGGSVDAAVGRARAELDRTRAALQETENVVRQAVLEEWLALQSLQVEAERVVALQDYRDLYLDRSRAVYELEVKTDLGDAMVRLSEAQLAEAENRFKRALAWERLLSLTDGLPKPAGGG